MKIHSAQHHSHGRVAERQVFQQRCMEGKMNDGSLEWVSWYKFRFGLDHEYVP